MSFKYKIQKYNLHISLHNCVLFLFNFFVLWNLSFVLYSKVFNFFFSDENQRECATLFPQAFRVIEGCKEISVSIALASLIGQTTANNSK